MNEGKIKRKEITLGALFCDVIFWLVSHYAEGLGIDLYTHTQSSKVVGVIACEHTSVQHSIVLLSLLT